VQPIGLWVKAWAPTDAREELLRRVGALETAITATNKILLEEVREEEEAERVLCFLQAILLNPDSRNAIGSQLFGLRVKVIGHPRFKAEWGDTISPEAILGLE
jgi:hypothetical protein